VAVLAAGGAGAGVWLLTRDDASDDKTTSKGTSDRVEEDLPNQPEGGSVPPPSSDKSRQPTPSTGSGGADDSGSGGSGQATSGTGGDDATGKPGDSGPAGYRTVDDPLGFQVAVPDGFTRSSEPPRVFYYSAGKTFRLGVHPQPEDPDGPLAVMQKAHAEGPENYPGYRGGSVRETTHNGHPAALWEFTWDGTAADGGPRRTYDLSWNENGKMHDVWLSAPTAQQTRGKQYFDKALETFVAPPG
ncbi:serine/threonine protein kinase, partial [Streptomyces sp. T-3]|nr:serine/threonine protein kinase [Streptomyces sp. T-3]